MCLFQPGSFSDWNKQRCPTTFTGLQYKHVTILGSYRTLRLWGCRHSITLPDLDPVCQSVYISRKFCALQSVRSLAVLLYLCHLLGFHRNWFSAVTMCSTVWIIIFYWKNMRDGKFYCIHINKLWIVESPHHWLTNQLKKENHSKCVMFLITVLGKFSYIFGKWQKTWIIWKLRKEEKGRVRTISMKDTPSYL